MTLEEKNTATSPELRALGAKVRRLRKALGISQEELAWRSKLHRTYLSDVERGARNLSTLSLVAIARGLQTTVSELARDIESINPSAGDVASTSQEQ